MPYLDKRMVKYGYGEYFPTDLSPFAYNETVANEFFPLSKEQIIENKYNWKEKEERNYKVDLKNTNIPDDISQITESVVGQIIECEHQGKCNEQCTEAFKITQEEFQFYKRMNIPIPRFCSNCRHYQRLKLRNPLKLWHRSCMCDKSNHGHTNKCQNEFETSYDPNRPEIVYCEKCYQQEVY